MMVQGGGGGGVVVVVVFFLGGGGGFKIFPIAVLISVLERTFSSIIPPCIHS